MKKSDSSVNSKIITMTFIKDNVTNYKFYSKIQQAQAMIGRERM